MAKKALTLDDFMRMREKLEKDLVEYIAAIGVEFILKPFARMELSIVVDADQTTWKVLDKKLQDVTDSRTVKAAFQQVDILMPPFLFNHNNRPRKARIVECLIDTGKIH